LSVSVCGSAKKSDEAASGPKPREKLKAGLLKPKLDPLESDDA